MTFHLRDSALLATLGQTEAWTARRCPALINFWQQLFAHGDVQGRAYQNAVFVVRFLFWKI